MAWTFTQNSEDHLRLIFLEMKELIKCLSMIIILQQVRYEMQNQHLKEGSCQGQSNIDGKLFPKLYTAQEGNNFIYLQEYFEKNKKKIIQQISEAGAVYFQGFGIRSANEMAAVLNKLGLASFQYVGGAAVRNLIVGSKNRKIDSVEVFTSNECPPNQQILFHNQLLQNPNYPDYLSFYCYSEANEGGSTPLASGTEVYKYIEQKHPQFLDKLVKLGVRYTRVVGKQDNSQSLIGRGWKKIYKCQTKQQLEKKVHENGYQLLWLENEDCKLTSQVLKGIVTSKSGKKSFCNQMIAALKGWKDDKNVPENSMKFGDGSEVPLDILNDIFEYAQSKTIKIQSKAGDFMIIDNQMVMHKRQSFKGYTRKIYASLLKGQKPIKEGLYQTLTSGDQMPMVGFGTWKLPNEVAEQIVYNAIKNGYKLIDCAGVYGNEVQIGKGVNKAISEKIIERSDLFVTSKLWNTFHRPQHVKTACLRTLKDLNVQYLDLYLMHYPIALKYVDPSVAYPTMFTYEPVGKQGPKVYMENVPIIDTWRAMEELVQEGLVRNIGVSNFNVSLLRDLINGCKIPPAVNQIQIHPYFTQKKLIKFCQIKGVQVTSYSTMGGASYVEMSIVSKDQLIVQTDVVKKLAKQYGKTQAQILFRWAVQQGLAIIPKTSKIDRLKENLDVTGWCLQKKDMQKIDALNKNKKYCDPINFLPEQDAIEALIWN